VLTGQTIVATPTVVVNDVRCAHEPPGWSAPELVERRTVVLIRSGLFRRRVGTREMVLDSSTGYLPRPGTEEAFAHPAGGDRCTSIAVCDEEMSALLGAGGVPDTAIETTPQIDVAHRALLARARSGATPDELAERAHVLVGAVLAGAVADGCGPVGRLPGPRTSRRAVDQVRERLAVDLSASLTDLARHTGLSPYHLSRVFRRTTGCTITGYRTWLRLRAALDQLASGETNLARLAMETGFSDQAHLTRLLRREIGQTPGALRRMFATGRGQVTTTPTAGSGGRGSPARRPRPEG
jgi:AraC-like DNA-binding protein